MRELTAKLTEGENSILFVQLFVDYITTLIVFFVNCSKQYFQVISLPPSKTSFLPPPSSEGGKGKSQIPPVDTAGGIFQ